MTTEDQTPEIPTIITTWLGALGVAVGDTVMILPVGSVGGQGFQGELVTIVFGDFEPTAVVIRQSPVSPNVVIPWRAVSMITKVTSPEADAETVKRIQEDFERATGESLADYAKKNGIDIDGTDLELDASNPQQ